MYSCFTNKGSGSQRSQLPKTHPCSQVEPVFWASEINDFMEEISCPDLEHRGIIQQADSLQESHDRSSMKQPSLIVRH